MLGFFEYEMSSLYLRKGAPSQPVLGSKVPTAPAAPVRRAKQPFYFRDPKYKILLSNEPWPSKMVAWGASGAVVRLPCWGMFVLCRLTPTKACGLCIRFRAERGKKSTTSHRRTTG